MSKFKSHGRIDGMVALAMAAAVSGANMMPPPPEFITEAQILARGGFA